VGVRELIHDMPDLQYATSPAHVTGVRAAGRAGLAYDLLLKPQHLRAAVALVDLLPDQRFVVDHLAKPDIAGGVMQPWAADLAELAQRDNVWCKVSGMVTEGLWSGQPDSDFQPYVDVVLEAFGSSRVMVGSDWPVCTCAHDYTGTMNLARRLTAQLSSAERERVSSLNCIDFYGLS
jgi:L-fuconolactonase